MRMIMMLQENESVKARLASAEREGEDYKEQIKTAEEEHATVLKAIKEKEIEFDKISAELDTASAKLEERKVTAANAALDIGTLSNRINLTENELNVMKRRLEEITSQLTNASQNSEESERGRKELEVIGIDNDDKINALEKEALEAQAISLDADKRYDEESRRYAIMEMNLEQVEDRADAAEAKLEELNEELNVVAKNMKALEISEQEALTREESYIEQIKEWTTKLKESEEKADLAETTAASLQREVYRLERELEDQLETTKTLKEQLDQTLVDLDDYE